MDKKTILIVDDDPFIRSEIASLIDLEFTDIETIEAKSAEDSCGLFQKSTFDLVVADINLPGLSGLDLVATLYEPNPYLEFVIITGKSNILEDYEMQLVEMIPPDRIAFLRKPFENDELYFLIAKSLKKIEIAKKNQELMANISQLAQTGAMVHGIAHDLKGFLTGIQLLAGDDIKFILENMDINAQKEHLIHSCDEIVDSTETAFQFIEALLAPQRITNETKPMDIIKLVQHSIMPLSYLMRKHGIKLKFQFPEDPVYVIGNNQLIRVMMNLLKNAIEATENKNSGCIRIYIAEEDKEVTVSFIDNGNGISFEILSKLKRGLQVTTKKETGNGLGILGAYQILTLVGGRLEIDSAKEKGATFKVILKKQEIYESTDC